MPQIHPHLSLVRTEFTKTGVFGHISDEDDNIILFTHEAYFRTRLVLGEPQYEPQLNNRRYVCSRAKNKFDDKDEQESFRIFRESSGGKYHWFYPGPDSDKIEKNCITLGLSKVGTSKLLHTVDAFKKFMKYLDGYETFILTIEK